MDLVTLMTLWLTARQVGADRFGNRYYEERRARQGKAAGGMSDIRALPRPQKYRLTGMGGCIISIHHRRRSVAMKSMSGSGSISPMSPEQSTPIALAAIYLKGENEVLPAVITSRGALSD